MAYLKIQTVGYLSIHVEAFFGQMLLLKIDMTSNFQALFNNHRELAIFVCTQFPKLGKLQCDLQNPHVPPGNFLKPPYASEEKHFLSRVLL